MAEQQREELVRELGNLKTDIAEMKEHVGALARVVKDVVKAEGSEARARFESQAQEILERMSRMVEEAKLQSRLAYEKMEATVQERPMASVFTSLGIGVAIGFITSKIFSRRS